MTTYDDVATLVAGEAAAARQALPGVGDAAVEVALGHAARLVRERRADLLAANAEDVAAGEGRLDAGSLDRLRLDDARVENIAVSLAETASLPPLDRDVRSWRLDNGLQITERRVPVGTIGANFEARPNVAADVASQVLKSGNTVVLRTGGAALRTVTALVDHALRPALEEAGIPPTAVGLVRTPERAGAETLVSLPHLIPLVILRGSGPSTAALARRAAEHGVRTLAHAEGGGVLYVHSAADPEKAVALARASLDRLGVCNRLNLALADSREQAAALLPVFAEHGLEVRATERAARARRRGAARHAHRARVGQRPRPRQHRDARRRGRPRGRAADRERRDLRARRDDRDGGRGGCARVPRRLSRYGRVLERADAVHRRVRAARHAGDRHQRRLDARAARPGHVPRSLAAPVPRGRRRHTAPVTVVVKLGSTLVVDGRGRVRRSLLRARAEEIAELIRGGEQVCVVSSGAIALGLAELGLQRRPKATPQLQAASAVGQARLQAAWAAAFARDGLGTAQVLLSAGDVADRASYVNLRNAFDALLRLGRVPIVNENDATATDEITFGDNDALAAHTALLVRARLLVLLTEVEGVFSEHPAAEGATLLAEGDAVADAAIGPATGLGRGGMASKIAAAQLAAGSGVPTVVASGRGADVLGPIAAGEHRGTRFNADESGDSAWRLWLRHAKPATGRIVVDAGARKALVEDGRSLLAVGVTACEGTFVPGDAVELAGPDGEVFAKGIASAGASELAGQPRGLEAVHRDRLVVY